MTLASYLFDEPLTLTVPLRHLGEPIIPDAGSVKLNLRGQDGSLLIENEQVVMLAGSTEATFTIPAPHNAAGGVRFGHRTVVLRYSKSGRPLVHQMSYRLTEWFNTTVTADTVREFIGLDRGELPDTAIDIPMAYMDVETAVSRERMEAALAAGDRETFLANRMIMARCVINLGPSLPLRISQSESNGVFSVTRPKIDLDKLMAAATAILDDGLNTLVPDLSADVTLLLAPALSPDPITGA